MSEQTWWDNQIKDQFLQFKSWVGDSKAHSKVWSRGFIKNNEFKSLIDIGCGNATEYFAYQEEYPELEYTGLDSSRFLQEFNLAKHVPMVLAEADDIPLKDNYAEVAFSRHVLEHQDSPYPILNEMIRLGSKVAMHVFFIPPGEREIINYDEKQNLYHNTFKKEDLEKFATEHPKVESFDWVVLNSSNEEILTMYLR